ncbi:MAG: hypothetical protein QOE61_4397 [Micromonosporaceae bacterium]|nr:hypothetical protein [Micromonosporaceae bacterium]
MSLRTRQQYGDGRRVGPVPDVVTPRVPAGRRTLVALNRGGPPRPHGSHGLGERPGPLWGGGTLYPRHPKATWHGRGGSRSMGGRRAVG